MNGDLLLPPETPGEAPGPLRQGGREGGVGFGRGHWPAGQERALPVLGPLSAAAPAGTGAVLGQGSCAAGPGSGAGYAALPGAAGRSRRGCARHSLARWAWFFFLTLLGRL